MTNVLPMTADSKGSWPIRCGHHWHLKHLTPGLFYQWWWRLHLDHGPSPYHSVSSFHWDRKWVRHRGTSEHCDTM